MSERLEDLRRERALIAQHLAWLDREIEGAEREEQGLTRTGTPSHPAPAPGLRQASPSPTTPPAPEVPGVSPFLGSGPTGAMAGPAARAPMISPTIAGHPSGPTPAPEALLDEYRVAPDNLRSDVRKGCFLYFALAFVLLGLGVMVLWFAFRRE